MRTIQFKNYFLVNNYSTSALGYNYLISNKREWNNCFIKNAHKISMNLPDFILLEQTGKYKGLPLLTCHTSIKTVNARTDWMNEKIKTLLITMNTFKNSSGF